MKKVFSPYEEWSFEADMVQIIIKGIHLQHAQIYRKLSLSEYHSRLISIINVFNICQTGAVALTI